MQDSTTARTANKFMNALAEAFGEQVIIQWLQPACSWDLNSYEFYLWRILKDKVCVCVRIILIHYENRKKILTGNFCCSRTATFLCVYKLVFKMWDCTEAEGQRFELW
jgi:hypothetical protein